MAILARPYDVAEHHVSPERGFLPANDPLRRLPPAFSAWEEIAADLPKLLVSRSARRTIDALPPLDPAGLRTEDELERAMLLLSYFGHAYVWGEDPPASRIPAGLAVPWHAVGQRLGRPPVLSYASYALHNWRRIDPRGPIELGNIALLQNFLAGLDEEWFVLVHVDIEAKAGAALVAAVGAQEAAGDGDPEGVRAALETMASALGRMYATLDRMPEGCDPYIYYHRARPYIHGWKNHPVLTEGLFYEGVDVYRGAPQQFRGETGAQSSIIPSVDGALGIDHRDDPLRPYLMEMREYMPRPHRAFIERLEAGASVRSTVIRAREHPGLRDAYNACVSLVADFRTRHLEYAARYIQHQARGDARNPGQVGTGGTPFMPYLKKHRDESQLHLIR